MPVYRVSLKGSRDALMVNGDSIEFKATDPHPSSTVRIHLNNQVVALFPTSEVISILSTDAEPSSKT